MEDTCEECTFFQETISDLTLENEELREQLNTYRVAVGDLNDAIDGM